MSWYAIMLELSRRFRRLILGLNLEKSGKVGRPCFSWSRVFIPFCRILIQGFSWRDLPKKYGAKSTLHRIFKKCLDLGVFKDLLKELIKEYQELKDDPVITHIIDSTTVLSKALSRQESSISPQFSPKRGIKISILVSSSGAPVAYALSDAKTHDSNLVEKTLDEVNLKKNVKKPREKVLLADNGYTGSRVKDIAKKYLFRVICPFRKNQKIALPQKDKKALSNRFIVERSIAWIKQFKRLTLCYEKSLASYEGFLCIGLALLVAKAIGL